MKCKLRGRMYDVVDGVKKSEMPGSAGECDGPKDKKKQIRIREDQRGLEHLDTLLHEGLHACFWDFDESVVLESARDLARLLWRLGYRRIEE